MKRTPLRRVSKKKKEQDARYFEQRKLFLSLRPLCQVSLDMGEKPPRQSTDIHHMAGRGKNYLAVETWLAVSRHWHKEIHTNPKWARAQGYLK